MGRVRDRIDVARRLFGHCRDRRAQSRGLVDRLERLGQSGACRLVSGVRRNIRIVPDGGHQGHHVAYVVDDRYQRRAQHDRIRQAQRIGVWLGQALDKPDHIVAQIAE